MRLVCNFYCYTPAHSIGYRTVPASRILFWAKTFHTEISEIPIIL